MYRIPTLMYLTFLVVLISACVSLAPQPTPIPSTLLPTEALPIMGMAVVQSVILPKRKTHFTR
jgi:hypothetical protein